MTDISGAANVAHAVLGQRDATVQKLRDQITELQAELAEARATPLIQLLKDYDDDEASAQSLTHYHAGAEALAENERLRAELDAAVSIQRKLQNRQEAWHKAAERGVLDVMRRVCVNDQACDAPHCLKTDSSCRRVHGAVEFAVTAALAELAAVRAELAGLKDVGDEALVEVAAAVLREHRMARMKLAIERLRTGDVSDAGDPPTKDAAAVLIGVAPSLIARGVQQAALVCEARQHPDRNQALNQEAADCAAAVRAGVGT